MKDEELLSTLVSYFEEFEEQSRDARAKSERDRDYTDHKQWTDSELAVLKKRKQPPTINNRIRKKINYLRGYERQIRTDPKAFPRTPQHDKDAEAVTDALRFVADNAQMDNKRSLFWDNYIIEGTGGCEILISRDQKKEIQIEHIEWDRMFWDYRSRRLDFSDAKYKGIVIWADKDDILDAFPGKEGLITSSFASANDDTYEDKPVHWVDSKRNRVRICQIYFIHKGKWHLAFFTKLGFLTDVTESPWKDEFDQPVCGMEMQSAYIDRDGNRYGEPRFMIEQQDAINKRESKMLHLLNQRQTFGNKRAFPDGVSKQKGELAKADGHIEMHGQAEFGKDFGILPNGDMANGNFTLLQEAKAEMDQTSVNASLTGSEPRGLSGRAMIAQQTGGNIEITPLVDGKRQWEMRVYRQIWNRIRQFWTDERWVRVTDDEKNVKFVGLNRQVTVGELVQQELGFIPPEMANDPRLGMVAQVENMVSEIDVDIILEDAPDTVTIQQEQFDGLINLASAGVVFPPPVYIEASQLRNKDKLIEMIGGMPDPQAQAQQQQQQAAEQQQIIQAQIQAELAKIAAETADEQASAMERQASAQRDMAETQKTVVETHQMAMGLR